MCMMHVHGQVGVCFQHSTVHTAGRSRPQERSTRLPPAQVVGHGGLPLRLVQEAAMLLRWAPDDGGVLVLNDNLGTVLCVG